MSTPLAPAFFPAVISVSQLNRLTREVVERGLPLMWVSGEISNLVLASSGHCYFLLKDREAQVRCICYRQKLIHLEWLPENGAQVEVRALPTLYEPRGEFQLNVETLRRAGSGALFELFERLKARLAREGLFAPERKRALERFPKQIGVVTSPVGAAIRDVLSILNRRMPCVPVILYPTPVQGTQAAEKIAEAIRQASARRECEVLLLVRGGGSIEDLWAFNEEIVARAIHACSIPVVSGIGHETDFTIADFVADARAATPSAAAEMVSPNRAELLERLLALRLRLRREITRIIETRGQQLDYAARRLLAPGAWMAHKRVHLKHLESRAGAAWARALEHRQRELRDLARRFKLARPEVWALRQRRQALAERLVRAMREDFARARVNLQRIESHLRHLNPREVLARGYSIAETGEGQLVRSSREIHAGEPLKLIFSEGWARTQVIERGE
jgi:exodeoxyribonuclease VII large subunit